MTKKKKLSANTFVERVERELKRFSVEDVPDGCTCRIVVTYSGFVVETHPGKWNREYYFLARLSNGAYGTAHLTGVLANKWNVNVYSAIEGLLALGRLAKGDAATYDAWLRQADRDAAHEARIDRLMNEARQLGCEVNKIEKK